MLYISMKKSKRKCSALGFIIYRQHSSVFWLHLIKCESITHKIFRIQSHDSIMCVFLLYRFIKNMIAEKAFLGYTDFFPPWLSKEWQVNILVL